MYGFTQVLHHLSEQSISVSTDLLIDPIIHEELCNQSGQKGYGDPKAKATSGAVKRPPKAQGQGCQRQGQLNIIGKIQFLVMLKLRKRYLFF